MTSPTVALLEVRNLTVSYAPRDQPETRAVDDVSFDVAEGEFVGLLGESGCGKSTLGNAVLRLLERPAAIRGGSVKFDGVDLASLGDEELRTLRWAKLSTVFQSSMNSLNPVITVGAQFADTFAAHDVDEDVERRAVELLEMVSLGPEVLATFPHQLSGGMKQRVALALALALRPRFVLLDEPTTGLDVVVQRSILDRLRALQAELGFAVLYISHDIGSVLELADRVMVMYGGEIVEDRTADTVLRAPRHPYTQGLLASYADPRAENVEIAFIPGRPPHLAQRHEGCLFAPRCPAVEDRCLVDHPDLAAATSAEPCAAWWPTTRPRDHTAASQRAAAAGPRLLATVGPPRCSRLTRPRRPVLVMEGVSKRYTSRRGTTSTHVDAVQDFSVALRPGG